ncbi:MAG: ArsR/SmtB family transcription factor [Acidimicrobiia bacterium]
MIDLDVIDEPAVAAAALDPVRARILAALAQPGSAASVADELGIPRQNVNYHLRALEAHGLVEFVEHRPKRGLTERVVQATARSYVIAPPSLGIDAADPKCVDRLSSRYLIAVAARLVREVADLARRADAAKRPVATLTIDTDIRFRSAAERAAFTEELAQAVTSLASRYHDERSAGGRWHRLVVASHPIQKEVSR